MAQEHLYSSARIVIRGLIALKITNLAGVLPPGFAEDFHALEPLLCFSTVQALLLCIAEMVIFTGNVQSTDEFIFHSPGGMPAPAVTSSGRAWPCVAKATEGRFT